MPLLSNYARARKVRFFLDPLPKSSRILEIGCGDGWIGRYLKANGWTRYVGLDLRPPADIVGDIRDWRRLGMQEGSFDVVIAFEIVEHVDCWQACHDLLRPGGTMLITTPLPHRDWILAGLELLGLNQRRTSPHDHLVHLARVPLFARKDVRIVGGLSQWAIFTK